MPVPSQGHYVFTVFTVFRLLTDFVCLYNYEFGLSLCKIVRSSVILLLPLYASYHISVHLAKLFQSRKFLEIDQTETRIACGVHVC